MTRVLLKGILVLFAAFGCFKGSSGNVIKHSANDDSRCKFYPGIVIYSIGYGLGFKDESACITGCIEMKTNTYPSVNGVVVDKRGGCTCVSQLTTITGDHSGYKSCFLNTPGETFSDCGGHISSPNAQIWYPSYGLYKPLEDCKWIINSSQSFNIKFKRFELADSCNDTLSVAVDGKKRQSFCGVKLPQTQTSQTGKAVIEFSSDEDENLHGFYLEISGHVLRVSMPEHQKRTITCPPGQILNIRSAVYGKPPTCIAVTTERVVKSLCNERYTCTLLASNSVFGDPCPDVYKSLAVEYQCYLSETCTSEACIHGVCDGDICRCKPGYIGRLCEKETCTSEACIHGVCDGDICRCKPGYIGRLCDKAMTTTVRPTTRFEGFTVWVRLPSHWPWLRSKWNVAFRPSSN